MSWPASAARLPRLTTLAPHPRRRRGSHPRRRHRGALPQPKKVHERVLRLAESPHTDHLLGVNDFFVRLAAHARTHSGYALTQWRNEKDTATACGGIVGPDGYGEWTHTSTTAEAASSVRVGFFLEYDTGTEPLGTLTDKIDKYIQLAHAGLARPLLLWLPNTTRRDNLRAAITRRHGTRLPITVYCAAPRANDLRDNDPLASPAAAVWLPIHDDLPVDLITIPTDTPAASRQPPHSIAA